MTVVVHQLYERVVDQLPPLLEAIDLTDHSFRSWVLVLDDDGGTVEPRHPDHNPLKEALLAVIDDERSGAIAVTHTLRPVEQVLCFAFIRVPMDLIARRAHVLRGESGVRLGKWRTVK